MIWRALARAVMHAVMYLSSAGGDRLFGQNKPFFWGGFGGGVV